METIILTGYPTGATLYAFPVEQSLDDWTTYRVLMIEGTGDDEGKYTASVDPANGYYWYVFVGSSQPEWEDALPLIGFNLEAVYPTPSKVLAGVPYGPNGDDYTGTAPESQKSHFPEIVRGDDYISASTQFTTLVADPGDLGSLALCSAMFAGFSELHGTGWKVTDGTVENAGNGLLRLRSSLPGSATTACKPGCNYKWTHTLVDASGEIRTQKHGVTRLIDGYAVDRFEE